MASNGDFREQDLSKGNAFLRNISRHECKRMIYMRRECQELSLLGKSRAVITIIVDARLRLARRTTSAIGTPARDARWTDERRRRWTVTAPGASSSGWRRAGHGPASRQHRQLRDLRREWQWLVSPRYGKSIVSCEVWTQNYHAPVVLRFRSDPRRGVRHNGEMPATADMKRPRNRGTRWYTNTGGTTQIPKDSSIFRR